MIQSPLFPGFLIEDVSTTGATIRTLRAGSGPPLLLLHGYPQTHTIWHKIAGRLAKRFTVVLTGLRGYGDSNKPAAFRIMAQDQVELGHHLGHQSFYIGFTTVEHEQLTGYVWITPRQSPMKVLDVRSRLPSWHCGEQARFNPSK
jgi:hypothetical protein